MDVTNNDVATLPPELGVLPKSVTEVERLREVERERERERLRERERKKERVKRTVVRVCVIALIARACPANKRCGLRQPQVSCAGRKPDAITEA